MVKVSFVQENMDGAHRTGMKKTEINPEKKVKSIVVKFKSWWAWKQFYNARPRSLIDGRKKQGYKTFSSLVDLTKRRLLGVYLPLR